MRIPSTAMVRFSSSSGLGIENFLYRDGNLQDFDALIGNPNPTYKSSPYRLNNRGEVVGSYFNGANMQHAFLYTDGGLKDLGTLTGGAFSLCTGINNRGQVIGWGGTNGFSNEHPFLYSKGKMRDLTAKCTILVPPPTVASVKRLTSITVVRSLETSTATSTTLGTAFCTPTAKW
jgi:probable HAF family extracellular repeat protein